MYSDFTDNLTIHPVKKDITLLTSENAVKRSVINLILTNFYERPYQPRLGSGITGLMFEQFNPIVQQTLQNAITKCITNNEPRANLISVNVSCDLDTGNISATIAFSVNNNSSQPVIVSMPLKRVR